MPPSGLTEALRSVHARTAHLHIKMSLTACVCSAVLITGPKTLLLPVNAERMLLIGKKTLDAAQDGPGRPVRPAAALVCARLLCDRRGVHCVWLRAGEPPKATGLWVRPMLTSPPAPWLSQAATPMVNF